MVVGDPYGGPTNRVLGAFYGCGDVTVDIGGSRCPNTIKDDLTSTLQKLPDRFCVIFVSVVLEYVENLKTCVAELERVSGGNLFVVYIQPSSRAFNQKYSSGKNDPPAVNKIYRAPPTHASIEFRSFT